MRKSIETGRAGRNSTTVLKGVYFLGKMAFRCLLKVPVLGVPGLLGAFFLLTCLPMPVLAQVQLIPHLKAQWLDQNGRPLANGCLFTYQSGTTTPQASFTDSTGGTPNPNPVILNGAGRPPLDVWLTGTTAYRIKLVSAGGTNCVSGNTQWQEDGINPSPASLLASNNTFTGSNTFNGSVVFNTQPTFNVGLTSSGPNVLAGGGTLSGTWAGSPVFSGTPNFSNGFLATTGNFSGQVTSTVTTGTSPFVIASTTVVANLNAALLNGCTFAIPCAIGSTTPNTGVFTTLQANTSFTLSGGTAQTAMQGTDAHIQTAGTFTAPAAGQQVCLDANAGTTNVGCTGGGFSKLQAMRITTGICTTANADAVKCTSGPYTWATAFADANYAITCSPTDVTGTGGNPGFYAIVWTSKTSTQFSVVTQAGSNSAGGANTTVEIDCIGVHP